MSRLVVVQDARRSTKCSWCVWKPSSPSRRGSSWAQRVRASAWQSHPQPLPTGLTHRGWEPCQSLQAEHGDQSLGDNPRALSRDAVAETRHPFDQALRRSEALQVCLLSSQIPPPLHPKTEVPLSQGDAIRSPQAAMPYVFAAVPPQPCGCCAAGR